MRNARFEPRSTLDFLSVLYHLICTYIIFSHRSVAHGHGQINEKDKPNKKIQKITKLPQKINYDTDLETLITANLRKERTRRNHTYHLAVGIEGILTLLGVREPVRIKDDASAITATFTLYRAPSLNVSGNFRIRASNHPYISRKCVTF